MKTADLTYRIDGMFTRFYAETESGVDAWNTIAKENEGVAVVFNHQRKSTIDQLRKAGYTVKKQIKMTDKEVAELENDIDALFNT